MRALVLALLAGCASVDHFPPGTLAADPSSDRFYDEWFSKHLVALYEPSLAAKASGRRAHVVRVLLLPTWSGATSLRMVVRPHGGGVLVIRKTSGMAGYEAGHLHSNGHVVLTRRQVARVLTLLAQMDFWIAGPGLNHTRGPDGTEAVLEVVRDGRHHVVYDTYGGDLARVARLLLHYARLGR